MGGHGKMIPSLPPPRPNPAIPRQPGVPYWAAAGPPACALGLRALL